VPNARVDVLSTFISRVASAERPPQPRIQNLFVWDDGSMNIVGCSRTWLASQAGSAFFYAAAGLLVAGGIAYFAVSLETA